ncbi:hypothetical protein KUL113_46280 [Tenacibaculum sp. KUL113]|nr:hypothetical protein KUL113_46280 [Tenacibaculum sp. KUL113]
MEEEKQYYWYKRKDVVDRYPVEGNETDEQLTVEGELFSGVLIERVKTEYGFYRLKKYYYIKGETELIISKREDEKYISYLTFNTGWLENGYSIGYGREKPELDYSVYEMGALIHNGDRNIYNDKMMFEEWQDFKDPDTAPCYSGDRNIIPYYNLQSEIQKRTIKKDCLKESEIRYIAAVDVGYDELDLKMVGSVVLYDLEKCRVVEEQIVSQDILFNYCNDLFSYREVPMLLKAFAKITISPDLILCKGHGIAHPRHVGLATHLGVELDLPSIGCARDRVLGIYENLDNEAGSSKEIVWRGKIVGNAFRVKTNEKPIFISIGHKVSLETACKWSYKLLQIENNEDLLPYPLLLAENLVSKSLENRTHIVFIETEV